MRICAYVHCERSLEGRSANTRFCGSTCRAREHDQRKLEGTDPDTFWVGLRALQGASRSAARAT